MQTTLPKLKTEAVNKITSTVWGSAKKKFEDDIIKGLFSEPAEIQLADKSGSAYWFWCAKSHQIRVCADVLDSVPTVPDPKNLPLFLQRVVRHESAHARYTARRSAGGDVDLHGLRDHLDSIGVGHEIWNLAEDCWIEGADRKDNGYRYGWRKWIKPSLLEDYSTVLEADRGGENAGKILLDIKNCDSERALLVDYVGEKSLKGGTWEGSQCKLSKRARVYRAYKEILDCQNSWRVAEVARRFLAVFPDAIAPPCLGALLFTSGGSSGEGGWAEIVDRAGNAPPGEQSPCAPIDELARKHPNNIRSTPVNQWSSGCGKAALEGLRKGLKAGTLKAGRTTSPTSNLNVKDFLNGKPDCYRKAVESRSGKGQRVEVVYDLSGSMGGGYHESGIQLLDALKSLHDSGEIRLRITWVSSSCLLQWEGDKFQSSDLQFIAPGGGSPLGQGLSKILPDIDRDSLVVAYTDGSIDRSTYSREAYMRAGVLPLGAFVTSNVSRMNSPIMSEMFEQYQVSADIASCALGLGQKLKAIRERQR